jgi:signal transduction histidine kinase
MTGVILIGLSLLGFAVAALVLRADSSRLDNRMFALLSAADSTRSAIVGAVFLDGYPLASQEMLVTSTVGGIAVAYLSVEFAYSFPFDRRAPRWLRLPVLLGALASIALVLHPATRFSCDSSITFGFFLPSFLVIVGLLYANYRRLVGDRAGIAVVMLAIALRWAGGMFAYLVAYRLSARFFERALFFELTIGVALGLLLMVWAILKHQLFRVRGALAEVTLYACSALAIVGLTVLGVEGSLRYATGPIALRTSLVLVGLLPLSLVGLALHVRSRLEQSILCPLDPRRAKRKAVLERALAARASHPEGLIEITTQAMREMTLGGSVRWERTVPAPAEASLYLFRGSALDAEAAASLAALDADLVVAAAPHGAVVVKGGLLDRDSVLTAVTLTQQLALRLENLALVAELEESRRLAALGSFAAAIAHDIRTPLTSVQMNVQILRARSGVSADDLEYFDIALAELKRLNEHVQELLDFAKPVRLHAARMDLREVVDETARGMEALLAERRVALQRRWPEDLPAVVGDPQRLRQVLWNLLDNAARASHAGSAIVLRTTCRDGQVAIEVEDAGSGIPAEDLPRIFEPFFTTRSDGTGLGLAICHKLVRAHQGEIQVRSTPGKGSTFTVLLPAAGNASLPG